MEPYTRYEHAGVIVEIVQDDEPFADPQDNDNAGTIYSWTREWNGDERIAEPELTVPCDKCEGSGEFYEGLTSWIDCPKCESNGYIDATLEEYLAHYYNAVLTIPLRFSDYGSTGARLYGTNADNANCALCFTQEEIDYEWSGHLDPYPVEMKNADGSPTGEVREYGGARGYAEGRIDELDQWMQGNVWGIVIRERDESIEDPDDDDKGAVLESVWGFIGDPDADWIKSEANSMAEACAAQVRAERRERFEWECRDVVTV